MSATVLPSAVPSRPLLRWYGGKWQLAPWIIRHMPPHDCYIEPYAGAASVLMRKAPVKVEILGDLDDELLCLFSVVRDAGLCGRLAMLLHCTPYSDAEYERAREPVEDSDPVERARRMIVRHAMGRSGDMRLCRATGFRRYTGSDRTSPGKDWDGLVDAVAEIRHRLRGVVVERLDACETIRRHDRPDALVYADPPYLASTRKAARKGYRHELGVEDHKHLLECLLAAKGMAMVSGYASPLYDDALEGWGRFTMRCATQGMTAAEEVLWISPRAMAARESSRRQPDLFEVA